MWKILRILFEVGLNEFKIDPDKLFFFFLLFLSMGENSIALTVVYKIITSFTTHQQIQRWLFRADNTNSGFDLPPLQNSNDKPPTKSSRFDCLLLKVNVSKLTNPLLDDSKWGFVFVNDFRRLRMKTSQVIKSSKIKQKMKNS